MGQGSQGHQGERLNRTKKQMHCADRPRSWDTSLKGWLHRLASEPGVRGQERKQEEVQERGYWDGTARRSRHTPGAPRKKDHSESGYTKLKRKTHRGASAGINHKHRHRHQNNQGSTWWKGADCSQKQESWSRREKYASGEIGTLETNSGKRRRGR